MYESKKKKESKTPFVMVTSFCCCCCCFWRGGGVSDLELLFSPLHINPLTKFTAANISSS